MEPEHQILSISGWQPIRLNNAIVFPEPEPLIINILRRYQEFVEFRSCSFMFSFVI